MTVTDGSQEAGGRHLRSRRSVPASCYFELKVSHSVCWPSPPISASIVPLEFLLCPRCCLSPRECSGQRGQHRLRVTLLKGMPGGQFLCLSLLLILPDCGGAATCSFLSWSSGKALPAGGRQAAAS